MRPEGVVDARGRRRAARRRLAPARDRAPRLPGHARSRSPHRHARSWAPSTTSRIDTFLRVTYSLALLPVGRAAGARGQPGPGRPRVDVSRALGQRQDDADPAVGRRRSAERRDLHRARRCGRPALLRLALLGRPGAPGREPRGAAWRRSTSSGTPIDTSAAPLTPARALTALLPNVLFFATEPDLVARVLEVTAELTAAVPCFALGFRPEPSVWEVIAAA